MLAVEIAVHIANPAVIDTADKQIVMLIKELSAELLQRRKPILFDPGSKKRLEIVEIFRPLLLDIRRIIKSRAFLDRLRSGVKGRQNFRHGAHHLRCQLAGIEQKRQYASLRQSSHDEGVFHRLAPSPEPPTCRIETDGHDRQINRRRQSPIETQFFVEEMVPLAQGRIVEKRKTDRLLHLIDKILGQKDM